MVAKKNPLAMIEVEPDTGCWLWTGFINSRGYAEMGWRGGMHRWMYEWLQGPIPAGLELDHLCRVRHCVNPDHLEPVTRRENIRRSDNPAGINSRKTHCIRGHEFDDVNTIVYMRRTGRVDRECRACRRLRYRKAA